MTSLTNLRVRFVCSDGLIAQAYARVLPLSPQFHEILPYFVDNQMVAVPIPGWIIYTLIEWMELFSLDVLASMASPNDPNVVFRRLDEYDFILASHSMFELLTLHLCGVYLRIDRLNYVTAHIIRRRPSDTENGILVLGDVNSAQLAGFLILYNHARRYL